MNKIAVFISLYFLFSNAYAENIPFDDMRWNVVGDDTKITTYKGEKALYSSEGGAFLTDAAFLNGVIEFDILFTDNSRGFSGVTWRKQSNGSYENFYIRPHLSNQPDSTQYTPSFMGDTGWQLYFGPNYSVPLDIKFDQWMHIKIIVAGDQAEIYIDSTEPVLFVNDLKADLDAGAIGVSTSLAPTYFANFSYEKMASPQLKGTPLPDETLPVGLIEKFSISEIISDDFMNPKRYSGSWTDQSIETMGAINISRNRDRTDGHNTVLVRLIVNSDHEQIKKFKYGYSDDVIVYIDNKPVAGGTNIYQTRDYRYLGTIGLFDDVYIPLKSGKNEIYFAVKENFGGWGFMGMFENCNGITIE